MPNLDDGHIRSSALARLRAGDRLECRECGVVCERVVSPWRCLRSGSRCIYAYEEDGSTYFGCLHKVFSPELDMAAFAGAGSATSRGDPYGAIRVVRPPRPECPVTVERAYATLGLRMCVNPAFMDQGPANMGYEKNGRPHRGSTGAVDPRDFSADADD